MNTESLVSCHVKKKWHLLLLKIDVLEKGKAWSRGRLLCVAKTFTKACSYGRAPPVPVRCRMPWTRDGNRAVQDLCNCFFADEPARRTRGAAAPAAAARTGAGVSELAGPHRQAAPANAAALPSGSIHGTSSGGFPNSSGDSHSSAAAGLPGWGSAACPLRGSGPGMCPAGFLGRCSSPPHTQLELGSTGELPKMQ